MKCWLVEFRHPSKPDTIVSVPLSTPEDMIIKTAQKKLGTSYPNDYRFVANYNYYQGDTRDASIL